MAGIRVGTVDRFSQVIDQRYWLAIHGQQQTTRHPIRRLTFTQGKPEKTALVHIDELRQALALGLDSSAAVVWALAAEAWLAHIREIHGADEIQLYYSHHSSDVEHCGKNAGTIVGSLRDAAIYDHHHLLSARGRSDVEEAFFWEFYSKDGDQRKAFEEPSKTERRAIEAEFLAASIARIVVLDERVQAAIETAREVGIEGGATIAMKDAVKMRRIYVPSNGDLDLWQPTTRVKLEEYLTRERQRHLDFVVVHLGILERLPAPKAGEKNNILWMRGLVEGLGAELVICSGRGAPPQVRRESVRFVPLSSVLRWVVDRPSKFHLYDLLCASRSLHHA